MAQDLYNTLMNLQCELVAERNLVNPEQISWLQYDILNRGQSAHCYEPAIGYYAGQTVEESQKIA